MEEQCKYVMNTIIKSSIIIKHNSFSMLRILISRPYRFFSTAVQPAKCYQIIKLAYLIESPPKRTANPFALFVREESAGKKIKSIGQNSHQLSQKWHKSPQIQDKFKKLYEESGKDYPQQNQQYIKKFVTPFKRISYSNILMKQISAKVKSQIQSKGKQQGKSIDPYGKELARIIKQNKPQEIEAAKKEAQRIKSERQAIISQYKFPVLAFKSLRSYSLRHAPPKEQRGPTYKQDLQKGYNQHLNKWRGEVEEWLKKNNYPITIDQFITLYEKTLTAEKERKLANQEQGQE